MDRQVLCGALTMVLCGALTMVLCGALTMVLCGALTMVHMWKGLGNERCVSDLFYEVIKNNNTIM